MQTTAIYLTPAQAQMFIDFQKYHETFALLIQHGLFDIQYGKCTINIAHGLVQNIVREDVVYKR